MGGASSSNDLDPLTSVPDPEILDRAFITHEESKCVDLTMCEDLTDYMLDYHLPLFPGLQRLFVHPSRSSLVAAAKNRCPSLRVAHLGAVINAQEYAVLKAAYEEQKHRPLIIPGGVTGGALMEIAEIFPNVKTLIVSEGSVIQEHELGEGMSRSHAREFCKEKGGRLVYRKEIFDGKTLKVNDGKPYGGDLWVPVLDGSLVDNDDGGWVQVGDIGRLGKTHREAHGGGMGFGGNLRVGYKPGKVFCKKSVKLTAEEMNGFKELCPNAVLVVFDFSMTDEKKQRLSDLIDVWAGGDCKEVDLTVFGDINESSFDTLAHFFPADIAALYLHVNHPDGAKLAAKAKALYPSLKIAHLGTVVGRRTVIAMKNQYTCTKELSIPGKMTAQALEEVGELFPDATLISTYFGDVPSRESCSVLEGFRKKCSKIPILDLRSLPRAKLDAVIEQCARERIVDLTSMKDLSAITLIGLSPYFVQAEKLFLHTMSPASAVLDQVKTACPALQVALLGAIVSPKELAEMLASFEKMKTVFVPSELNEALLKEVLGVFPNPERIVAQRIQGFRTEYWNNIDLSGSPDKTETVDVIDFDRSALERKLGQGETLSARWLGVLSPMETGEYQVHVFVDDGVRLWMNRELVIDEWRGQQARFDRKVHLEAGCPVEVKLEFYQHGGDAQIHLEYTTPSGQRNLMRSTPPEVPQSAVPITLTDDTLPVPVLHKIAQQYDGVVLDLSAVKGKNEESKEPQRLKPCKRKKRKEPPTTAPGLSECGILAALQVCRNPVRLFLHPDTPDRMALAEKAASVCSSLKLSRIGMSCSPEAFAAMEKEYTATQEITLPSGILPVLKSLPLVCSEEFAFLFPDIQRIKLEETAACFELLETFELDGTTLPELPSYPDLPVGNQSYTVSAWIKPIETDDTMCICAWGRTQLDAGACSVNTVFVEAGKVKHSWHENDLVPEGPWHNILRDGQWHHVLVNYDGITRKMYINMEEVIRDSPGECQVVGNENFSIGFFKELPYGSFPFKGGLRDIRIFKCALHPLEADPTMALTIVKGLFPSVDVTRVRR